MDKIDMVLSSDPEPDDLYFEVPDDDKYEDLVELLEKYGIDYDLEDPGYDSGDIVIRNDAGLGAEITANGELDQINEKLEETVV